MKILIVDDEKISRKILAAKLKSAGDCLDVDSSKKALELFDKSHEKKEPFDLISLDISMPIMDGRQLLETIRKKEKMLKLDKKDQVKIIMVTARMNMSIIKECIKLGCNGYLSKPVSRYQLLDNLERMGFDKIKNDKSKKDKDTKSQIIAQIIDRFYKGKIKLPMLPRIVNEVQKLMAGEDPSIEDLGNIINKDILISTKLISIANSPLYKGVDKAENLNAALLRLGMKATYGLISTLVTKDLFKSDNKILNGLMEKLWMHSFACACFGKRIAEEIKNKNAETIFLMGIVHDIGKMLLIKAIADINPEETFEDGELLVAIHEIHTTFGSVVLKKMRFSQDFVKIAEFHHWNDFPKDENQELIIIHLSDFLADAAGYSFFCSKEEEKTQSDNLPDIEHLASLKHLGINKDKILEIVEEIKPLIEDSAKAF